MSSSKKAVALVAAASEGDLNKLKACVSFYAKRHL
jgi:hypothetical protein